MKLSLLVTEGIHAGDLIAIEGVSLLIGRGPQCHIRPNSPAIGLRHCLVLIRDERVFLRDLGSRTGTYLNDRQLRGEIELQDGDILQVGPLMFVVQMEGASAATPPDAPPPDAPPAARRPADEEMVDLTRFDDDYAGADEPIPDLEPYSGPTETDGNGGQAAERVPAGSASGNGVSRNGHGTKSAAPPHLVDEAALARIPSRARLTQPLRLPPT